MSTPAERVQRFLDNYEGTEIITSVRRLPPGCSCPVPLHLADLRALLADRADAHLLPTALERQAGDDGERMSLDDIATEFGFTKAELEGE